VQARIDDTVWEGIVAEFVSAVRKGRLADGMVTAINASAALLERHFPKP
jgi:uncharacterized membrane protein